MKAIICVYASLISTCTLIHAESVYVLQVKPDSTTNGVLELHITQDGSAHRDFESNVVSVSASKTPQTNGVITRVSITNFTADGQTCSLTMDVELTLECGLSTNRTGDAEIISPVLRVKSLKRSFKDIPLGSWTPFIPPTRFVAPDGANTSNQIQCPWSGWTFRITKTNNPQPHTAGYRQFRGGTVSARL
jgi:hypothetical protein